MSLPALALLLLGAVGPNGSLWLPALGSYGAVEGAPTAALAETLAGLHVVEHDHDGWNWAFYVGRDDGVDLLRVQLGTERAATARLLPGLRADRLFLHHPDYRDDDGRPRPIVSLAVDTAEILFSSLLEAHLARRLADDAGVSEVFAARAAHLMADVAPEDRHAAYASAVIAFGATALSVANELGRSQRRRRARGSSLCGLLDRPRSLMTHWRDNVVHGGGFAGIYTRSSDRATVTTDATLEAEDKQWVAERLLGVTWTGDAKRDFPWLCP